MKSKILLLTPPFTQLNTPYPATMYLKGFLNTKGIESFQVDLGIEVILKLFSKKGLQEMFKQATPEIKSASKNAKKIYSNRDKYIACIEQVICLLQNKHFDTSEIGELLHRIPRAERFNHPLISNWQGGGLHQADKTKFICTLFLEDLSDFIVECVDSEFGFSRYAERLGRSANSFDEYYDILTQYDLFIDEYVLQLLEEKIASVQPEVVAISIPFPGNLYAALRCGQFIKENYEDVKVVFGGGFPNTELRSLKDRRVFEFVDYICLDSGEVPFENLLEYLEGKRPIELLKRTFCCIDGEVKYMNGSLQKDYPFDKVGTPDYSDLDLNKYISILELTNPMHRLWTEGHWNKLTMAHGCYWGKCTFCDISLDYIKNYTPLTAAILCDRVEQLILQTKHTDFHFVDEAAPPALMKAFALELIKRKIKIRWWTNIRFEKTFTNELCEVLAESGCIAVTGGLEVASDRILALIEKGVSVEQVVRVCHAFTKNNIMVHAYLMYGFPSQTAQETIDALEIVRQFFDNKILHSAFWHQFALTAHSPVGLDPNRYGVILKQKQDIKFANNDISFDDPIGVQHERFSFGLKKSLYNYMQGVGIEFPLQEWFDFKIPGTLVDKDYVKCLKDYFR